MPAKLTRRAALVGAAVLPIVPAPRAPALGAPADEPPPAPPPLGAPEPFSPEGLRERAAGLARLPFKPVPVKARDALSAITYDTVSRIAYSYRRTLFRGETPYPVAFVHPGHLFNMPVGMHVVRDGRARRVVYSPELFVYDKSGLDPRSLPPDLGFAGFRLLNARSYTDWLVFLGASYFRTAGEENQYGVSARGVAVGSGRQDEEFPRFTDFWFEPPTEGGERFVVHALMDGPSVAGAYTFDIKKRTGAVMDVRADLFPRRDMDDLGIAPLTGMFWYAESNRRAASDWRPELHDNDGLSLWTGSGERIWRPLQNPPTLAESVFVDFNPRGFGLIQRDRNFGHYQDEGLRYERRPDVWVEPLDPWGPGGVHLIEAPTDNEIYDNINVFWRPQQPARAGGQQTFRYRLHWRSSEPFPPEVGRITNVFAGRDPHAPAEKKTFRFVLDFEGGGIEGLREEARKALRPAITASRGTVAHAILYQLAGDRRWRALFDVEAEGGEPVELRCSLDWEGQALSETWLYRLYPDRVAGG